jgi:hypothetical protein
LAIRGDVKKVYNTPYEQYGKFSDAFTYYSHVQTLTNFKGPWHSLCYYEFMQSLRGLVFIGAALAVAQPLLATNYSDFDQINQFAGPASVSGQFDLLLPGGEADSATMSGYPDGNGFYSDASGFQTGMKVDNATIRFWFSDPTGGQEAWLASISSANTPGLSEIIAGGGSFSTLFEADNFNGDDYATLILSISDTGKLNYTITPLYGGFNVDAGELQVSVPDGGSTALLMGFGFLAMAGYRKIRR